MYALLDEDAAVPAVVGLEDRAVEERALSGLKVAVSRLTGRPDATTEAALRHGNVVEALAHANDAVLPARFGTWFASADRLESEVEERAEELREALDHVRGCVEFGVRVARNGDGPPPPPAQTGTAYLQARLAATQETAHVATVVEAHLAPLARANTRRDPGEFVFNGAYLVETAAVDRFRTAADELSVRTPGLIVAVTGPWAPYSFAVLTGEAR